MQKKLTSVSPLWYKWLPGKETVMKPILFKYRSRKLHADDMVFIKALIDGHFLKGRSYISRELSKSWNWVQPNDKLKEYAA